MFCNLQQLKEIVDEDAPVATVAVVVVHPSKEVIKVLYLVPLVRVVAHQDLEIEQFNQKLAKAFKLHSSFVLKRLNPVTARQGMVLTITKYQPVHEEGPPRPTQTIGHTSGCLA